MNKLLTIVVPVYKVEPYINKCLDSCLIYKTNELGRKVLDEELMNQLEVIIVNDGTPDNSAEMSREYVKRYPQTFRQIDKENGGHGSAWNVGLKEATGKYLRFLDSDDWLTNLSVLMEDLEKCDSDVIFNPFNVCYTGGNVDVIPTPIPMNNDNSQNYISKKIWQASERKYTYSNVNFWGVTYKTEILKPLYPLFAEKVMYDDYILTWAPLVYGRTFDVKEYVVYNYLVDRLGNSMSELEMKKRSHSVDVCFSHYEEVRASIDERTIPLELLECMDEMIANYALFVFWYEAFFPYKIAKEKLKHLYLNYLKYGYDTRLLKRYRKLPFCLFYLVEQLRFKKNNS